MDISAIKSAVEKFQKPNTLDSLEPIRETLKQGHQKGMSLKQLCEVVRKNSALKPSPGSLRVWLKIPKQKGKSKEAQDDLAK